MAKYTIAIIGGKTQKKTIKEILDHAFESSNLDYELGNPVDCNQENKEENITEAIKNTPKLETDLKNIDYFA